jgi:hypothetical protein
MTQDEIIEMARQAGGIDITNNYVGVTFWLGTDGSDFFGNFAKLVAEKAREQTDAAIKEALAQPAQEPHNFCPRCGKRTADLTTIHTCTPPEGGTHD